MTESPTEAPAPTSPPEGALEVGRVQWWLDTIVAMAPQLRDAGITSVKVGDYVATLLPAKAPEPKYDDVKNEEPEVPDTIDALNDPRSYPGGKVPGFTIERLPGAEEY